MTDLNVITHADDCWSWGPGHYKCAVREIERLRAENERLRKDAERRGAGRVAEADITRHDLAFYQGALDAAFEECEQLERTLNLPPGVHTLIYTRLKQWESLLDKLGECLPDD